MEIRGSEGWVQKALTSTWSSHGNDLIMPDEQLSYVTCTHKELTYNEGSVLVPWTDAELRWSAATVSKTPKTSSQRVCTTRRGQPAPDGASSPTDWWEPQLERSTRKWWRVGLRTGVQGVATCVLTQSGQSGRLSNSQGRFLKTFREVDVAAVNWGAKNRSSKSQGLEIHLSNTPGKTCTQ